MEGLKPRLEPAYRWRDVIPRNPSTALETTLVVIVVCAVFYFGSQMIDLVSADVRAWLAGAR
jgi:hypothetical protein